MSELYYFNNLENGWMDVPAFFFLGLGWQYLSSYIVWNMNEDFKNVEHFIPHSCNSLVAFHKTEIKLNPI